MQVDLSNKPSEAKVSKKTVDSKSDSVTSTKSSKTDSDLTTKSAKSATDTKVQSTKDKVSISSTAKNKAAQSKAAQSKSDTAKNTHIDNPSTKMTKVGTTSKKQVESDDNVTM